MMFTRTCRRTSIRRTGSHGGCSPMVAFGSELVERSTAHRFDAIVAATPAIAERFRAYGASVILVRNSVRLDEFVEPNFATRRKRQAVYVGHTSFNRGLVEMVEACTAANCRWCWQEVLAVAEAGWLKKCIRRRYLSREIRPLRNRRPAEQEPDRALPLSSRAKSSLRACQPRFSSIWQPDFRSLPAICRSPGKLSKLPAADFRSRSTIAKRLTEKLSMLAADAATGDRIGVGGTGGSQQGLQLGA